MYSHKTKSQSFNLNMESQEKAIIGEETRVSSSGRTCNVILRLVAIAASLAAALVLGLAKETKTISISIAPTLPALPVTLMAKSSYSSAFMYAVVANAIACFYSLLSLVMSMAIKSKQNNLIPLVISVADVVILALLFSGNGAAAAIGMVGEKGIPDVRWNKVCNVFTKFCDCVMASLAVSFVACLAYVFIVLLALLNHNKRSPNV